MKLNSDGVFFPAEFVVEPIQKHRVLSYSKKSMAIVYIKEDGTVELLSVG